MGLTPEGKVGAAAMVLLGARLGRTHATTGARAGLLLAIQARRNGRWRSFDIARARGGGRFRYRYTFAQKGFANFSLRVRVPVQASWPYVAGASRAVRVFLR